MIYPKVKNINMNTVRMNVRTTLAAVASWSGSNNDDNDEDAKKANSQ